MAKKIIFFLLFLTMLSFAYAVDNSQVFQLNNNVTIKQSCYYNNTWCDDTTLCNITITNPQDNIILNNGEMTYQTTYFSRALGELNLAGTYKAYMVCSSHGLSGFQDFTFLVSRTGAELSSYNIVLYIIGIIGILAFAILMLFLANKVNFQSNSLWVTNINTALKWFMINLATVSSLIIVFFIRYILETQEKGNTMLINVFNILMTVMMYFIGFFFLISAGLMIYSFIENSAIAKKIKQELEDDN